MLLATFQIIGGFVLLLLGGEGTVRGASSIATRFKVSPYVIGATVVAFGTSTPELAVTISASLSGSPDLALGNVVGSNIANLGLILGLAAMVSTLILPRGTLRREVPMMAVVAILLIVFGWDGGITRFEGIVLLVAMVTLIVTTILSHRFDTSGDEEINKYSLPISLLFLFTGIAALIFGGNVIVSGATTISRHLGVPEWVIGIGVVAVGTSLPEVAASVTAAAKGKGELAIGNVFGSNAFNVLFVLGIGSVIEPIQVENPIKFDLIVFLIMTIFPVFLLIVWHKLPRWSGIILFSGYISYIGFSFGLFT
ncbi:calcium/sodium antiporter [bacterium]|nr:calcium/sodium antiporter [bacterium]